MFDINLQVNQIAELRIAEGMYKGNYQSRIEEIDSTSITLAMPISKGQLVPLAVGTTVEVMVFDQRAAYVFRSTIIKRQYGIVPVFKILYPPDIKRIQRRKYVRVEAKIPVKLELNNNDSDNENFIIQGETLDISGGGCKLIVTKDEFKQIKSFSHSGNGIGLRVKLDFMLPCSDKDYEQVQCLGELLRSGDMAEKWWISLKFYEIDERERDKIIKFVFDKQIELRRKGLL